ncbi:putative reverse transcriptase domain-containing protein [Tanacetum coccineum]
MDETHTSRYLVHLGADKMYYDLRDLYWWPGMKRYIVEYVSRCLTCSKIKAEHQKPLGFLQQPEIPEWKWEKLTIDFITKLPKSSNYKTEKLAKIYVNEIVARHGVPVSIISDRDGRFTSHLWQALQEVLALGGICFAACVLDFVAVPGHSSSLIEFSYNNSYHTSIKCLGQETEIDENLRFVEEPIEIVERDVKKLKRRRIPLVKVRWNSRQGAEYTWEREDQFRKKYPNLFSEPVPSSGVAT